MSAGRDFKKLNAVEKLYLKLTHKRDYKNYKRQLGELDRAARIANFANSGYILNRELFLQKLKASNQLNFVHSGNAGDIIYALPTLNKIAKEFNADVNLYIKLDQPLHDYLPNHPLGTVMMNKKMVDLLIPLIALQTYIKYCGVYDNQHIDVDLDRVREMGILLDKGNISGWYGFLTGVQANLCQPWLTVNPRKEYAGTLVLARSQRYRNHTINYTFLNQYPNKVFVGVEAEWLDIKKTLPNIPWLQVKSFLELAEVIAGCKAFVGNQSFPFSLADALKVPRILEVYAESPNVIPQGQGAHEFYFQPHLESLVKKLMQ